MKEASRLDPYVHGGSLLHQADARWKLAGVLGYVLLVGAIPWREWPAYLALTGLAGLAWSASKVAFGALIRRMAPLMAFGGVAALGALFRPGEGAHHLGRVAWLDLVVSHQGLQQAGLLMVRATLSGALVGVYIATTRFDDTVQALRSLGVPPVLTTTLSFVYRYLFVLVDEALRLDRARQARTLQKPSLSRVGAQARTHARLLGALLIRAYNRSERVYRAMLSRGYTGEMRTLDPLRWTGADTWAAMVWVTALTAVALATWL